MFIDGLSGALPDLFSVVHLRIQGWWWGEVTWFGVMGAWKTFIYSFVWLHCSICKQSITWYNVDKEMESDYMLSWLCEWPVMMEYHMPALLESTAYFHHCQTTPWTQDIQVWWRHLCTDELENGLGNWFRGMESVVFVLPSLRSECRNTTKWL